MLLEGLRYSQVADMARPVVIDYVMQVATSGKNEVWYRDKTYHITAPYYVDGCTLVIRPGTVVKLGDDDNSNDECIVVNDGGTVLAVGEPYLPVFFTAYSDDGYGENTDGGSGLPAEATPTRGAANYKAAFHFYAAEANDSRIQFCRIRWAKDGILNERSKLNHAVRDNVFNDCESAVRLFDWNTAHAPGPGVNPEITLTNNLIYYANHGLLLRGTSGGYETPAIYVALQQNTMDNIDYGALTLDGDSDMTYVYATARNNVFTSCYDGYADPALKLNNIFTGGGLDLDYTGFAQIDGASATGYFLYLYEDWMNPQGANDPPYQSTTPFDATHVANGEHYLDPTGAFVNAGCGTLADFGIEGMATLAPQERNCDDNYGSEHWFPRPSDTGTVDLGYHHPRVDYIVGVDPGSATPDQSTVYLWDLTINSGVVVALFRPDFAAGSEFFTNLICMGGLQINNSISDASELPFDREEMVHFDSSYYLGTRFVNRRWIEGATGHGMYTEAGTVWTASDYPSVWATLFRHMYIGLVLDRCRADQYNQYTQTVNLIRGCVFERGDAGIYAYELPLNSSPTWDVPGWSTVVTMFSRFRRLSRVAALVDSPYGYDSEDEHIRNVGFEFSFTNNTVYNCPYAVWIRGSTSQLHWVTSVNYDCNAAVRCATVISGDPATPDFQWVLFGSDIDSTTVTIPEMHDCFWNNGDDSPSDVDEAGVFIAFPTEYFYPRRDNPRFVSLASATRERECQSFYLSQNEGDASRIPLRIAKVIAASTVVSDATKWPSGDFRLTVYGLDGVGGWSGNTAPKASATIYAGNGIDDTWYNSSSAYEGDMMVAICRLASGTQAAGGDCWVNVYFANSYGIGLVFDASRVSGIPVGATLCLWVGLDGSTYYASASRAPSTNWSQMVSHDARYAMWHEDGSLMQSYWDAVGWNGALDIYRTNNRWSNGTTSTDGRVDNNLESATSEYRLLDVGYHYRGWDFKE
ncbi:hypothetical protein HS125_10450 [bacterium]|nr:hypothetical protein [bacterium]